MPAQCDPETCDIMAKEIDFAPVQGLEESFQYKYVMDVDGNAWRWGILSSPSEGLAAT